MMLYSDPLVTITEDEIVVHRYSFPLGGDKRVAWADIDTVRAQTPTINTGRWRLWGTDDFATWFNHDWKRPARPTLFKIKTRTQKLMVGFTAHDADRVKTLLAARDVLTDQQSSPRAKTDAGAS